MIDLQIFAIGLTLATSAPQHKVNIGRREMKKLACSCCDHREEFEMNTFELRAHWIRVHFEARFSCLVLVQCASRDVA